ncbi:unnamed protein product [Adineta ricciae]|uniref:Uncharacterized protein n=1 Tax=Adineta ricciae TaxID=249248 RepID=A0A816C269_ADIRI|nr:unnamed protein product [Adineta ricciae]CAF1617386.1 unnamed protein product [Adineta ricciae]
MTLRVTSTLLRRTSSLRKTVATVRKTWDSSPLHNNDDATYGSNEFIHRQFFVDDNYQAIIKCLNDGYQVCKDILSYLQAYHDLQHQHAEKLSSFTTEWIAKLNQQPTISSYNTTKRAQTKIIRSPNKLAQLIEVRCKDMQQVIDTFRGQVERLYPKERLSPVHKHYRAEQVRRSFKAARASVLKLSETLEKLHEQEEQAKNALHVADVQCENLSLDPTASAKKVTKANDNQEKRQLELEAIQDQIARTEKQYAQEQETYKERAMEIYKECRQYEQERLDQIRDILISFTQAAHTPDYSDGQDEIFDDLIEHIKTQQNSLEDLDFWAKVYGVTPAEKATSFEQANDESNTTTIESRKTKKSSKIDNDVSSATAANTHQSIDEDEGEQSTTNSNKNKQTKVKKSTSVDKKSNSTSESTTTKIS